MAEIRKADLLLVVLCAAAGQRQLPLQVDQQEVEGGLLRHQHGHQPHTLGRGHEPQRRLCGPGAGRCSCLRSCGIEFGGPVRYRVACTAAA